MLRIQNILAAVDFSAQNRLALSHAFELAEKFDARVHLVHVFTLQDKPHAASWTRAEAEAEQAKAQSELEAIALQYRPTGRLGEIFWREGDPAPLILITAEEHPVNLIVVGASSREGLARLLLGSVAESIVRDAKCSVSVVRAL